MQVGNHVRHTGSAPPDAKADRRATNQVLNHWHDSRRSEAVPTLMDLDLPVAHDAASSWFLLKEDSDPYLSVFIQCGERARAALSGRPQGRTLWEAAPRSIRSALCRACAKAIESQVPWRLEGTYETSEGADIRYRSIFLPIDGGGRYSGYVLGAFTSKRFANGSEYAGR